MRGRVAIWPGLGAASALLAVAGSTLLVTGCGDDGLPYDPSTREEVDLGSLQVTAAGLTDEVLVSIPQDAISMTLIASDPAAPEVLFQIIDPAGEVLTNGHNICTSTDSPLPVYPQEAVTVAMIPDNDTRPLLAGDYRVRIRAAAHYVDCMGIPAAAPGPVGLRALFKKVPPRADGKPGPLRGQRMALNVFLVGDVPHNRLLDGGLDRLRHLWRAADLDVGPPHFFSIGGDEASRFARLSIGQDESELRALFALSSRADEDGVNIFIVTELSAGPGYIIFGLAAGIPGTPERGGERSGVVVSSVALDPQMYDATFVGTVLAHETGHFLGLWHTTEAGGDSDPIDDTPTCPMWNDYNGNRILDRKECLGQDGNNLMFWEGDSFGNKETAAAGSLTKGQGYVARASAATH